MASFICCHCQVNCINFRTLLKHYKFGHGTDPQFRITCSIRGCAKLYCNVRTYLRHVKSKHELVYIQHFQNPNRFANDAPEVGEVANYNEDEIPEDEPFHYEHVPVDENHEVSLFLLNLREIYKTSQTSCTFVANEFADIMKKCRETISEEVNAVLQRSGVNLHELNDNGLSEAFRESKFEKAFVHFSSQKNIDKYVAAECNFVEPIEYVLGIDTNGKLQTMQYIPILKTLHSLLQFDDVLAEVYAGHSSFNDNILDFCDGANFGTNALFSASPESLQIQLYFDEFTVANPLGTHVHRLKFSAVYFVLGNLPPIHRSKLHVMQLAILCPSLYAKRYGLDLLLDPLISDLQTLEADGITFRKDGKLHTLRGTVSFLSADNLGAHDIGGFQTHFNAGRVCRGCNVVKEDLKQHFRSDTLITRTRETYDEQVEAVEHCPGLASMYGVKKSTPLNDLDFFHVTSGLPADLAHDLFEGVIPETLGEVIKHYVIDGLFSIEYLNERIKNFPYEGSDRTNKPSQLSSRNIYDLKVKETAAQAWCLLRMFPLMVGHLVPQDSEEWLVLLRLLDVTEYCTTSVVSPEHVASLADLIESFLTLYYNAFPNMSMKPKFHYLVHYPELLLDFGPLVNAWTLRFEGKHNYFKEVSRPTKNRKNLCKTLARRHEFMQASLRSSPNFLAQDVLNHSKGELYPVRLLPLEVQVLLLPLVGPSETVYKALKVQVNGTWYSTGLSVIVGNSLLHYGYKFARIEKCFLIGGDAYLLCRPDEENEYVPHLHAYSVQFGHNVSLIRQHELYDFYPLPIYNAGGMNLISIRHYVPF